jgi:hypothetical protein
MTARHIALAATGALLSFGAIIVAQPSMAAKKPVILWAHVDEDAKVVRGQGVERANRGGPRSYHVYFERNIQKCSVIVSAATSDTMISAVPIVDDLSPDVKNAVAVYVADRFGTVAVSAAFYLQITC